VNQKLLDLIQDDPRYMYEAYEFVCETVTYTQERLGRVPGGRREPAEDNHVCGEELLRGACELAIQQFGMMAPVVFKLWGVHATDDFGELVFNLIKIEQLSKSDRDDREDFRDVFDLHAALADGYELTTAAYPARKVDR
jgi:uncharacterized repeat protein (TIGR04138 family)